MTLARSRTWRVLAATLLACALLWPLLPAVAAARQTRSRRELAAQQQPVRVPQLPPATQQSKPTATPTPKQTPTPTLDLPLFITSDSLCARRARGKTAENPLFDCQENVPP